MHVSPGMAGSLNFSDNGRLPIEIVSYAYAGTGTEASGGDKIFVEFAKRWANENDVCVNSVDEGRILCRNNGVRGVTYKTFRLNKRNAGSVGLYAYKLIRGLIEALRHKLPPGRVAIYSSSDFWPDAIPAFIMKKRAVNAKWVAGLYLFAPSPFQTPAELAYRGGHAKTTTTGIGYYFSQRLVYLIMRRTADFVLVANELDKKIFVKDGYSPDRIRAIYGGVDLESIREASSKSKSYDGCFVGRLHPQKGALELVRIWKLVCAIRPSATLALIGDGPLNDEVRAEITKNGLWGNISMLGWVEGQQKYEILKSSRVFLHTPILDTGGMAAAEGMACGLPVVAFDLPGFQFSYPKGMVRVKVGNLPAFADAVLELLTNQTLYDKVKQEALAFSQEWDWNARASVVLNDIQNLFD